MSFGSLFSAGVFAAIAISASTPAHASERIEKMTTERKAEWLTLLTKAHVGRITSGGGTWFYTVADDASDTEQESRGQGRPIYANAIAPMIAQLASDGVLISLDRFDACDRAQYNFDFNTLDVAYDAGWGDSAVSLTINHGLLALVQTAIGTLIGSKPSVERRRVLAVLIEIEQLIAAGKSAEAAEKLAALSKSCPVAQPLEPGK